MKHLITGISSLIICVLALMLILSRERVNGQQGNSSGWSLQFGSSAEDNLADFAVDSSGNMICVGDTLGSMNGASGTGDIFVSKRATDGSLLWEKQFGTASGDTETSTAVDVSGNVYVAGGTSGQLFGAAPATDTDSFIAKYDANGNLVWGRQFRGAGIAQATAVAVGGDGSVYVAGATDGNYGGPNAGLADPSVAPGSDDIYIMKLSSSGTSQWTKQFGSTGNDDPSAMMLDSNGNIILSGTTYHWLRPSHGSQDIFLAKLTPDGTMIWASEFGTTLDNYPTSLYVNGGGNIYLATAEGGNQTSDGQPIPGQCKLYSFSGSGTQLWVQLFSTQVPSDKTEITGISYSGGSLFIGGNTTGSLFGPSVGFQNVFLANLSTSGTVISSYQFGSAAFDDLSGLVTDATGNIYLGGSTGGSLFSTNLGANDIFLQKMVNGIHLAQTPKDAMERGLLYAKWDGRIITLQHPSFHRGSTAYIYAGYLCSGIPGAKVRQTATKQIVVEGPSKQVVITPSTLLYRINGKPRTMSARPVMVGNRCYVPLDVMKAVLPYPVHYEAKAQTVHFDPPQPKTAQR